MKKNLPFTPERTSSYATILTPRNINNIESPYLSDFLSVTHKCLTNKSRVFAISWSPGPMDQSACGRER